MDVYSDSMVIYSDFMVIYSDFIVTQWDLMGSNQIDPLVNVEHKYGKSPISNGRLNSKWPYSIWFTYSTRKLGL